MATYNTKATTTVIYNCEGAPAYDTPDEIKLAQMVITSFMNETKFYGDNTAEMVALAEKICKKNPDLIAKLAIYARCSLNMRSTSHMLASVLAKHAPTKPAGPTYVRATIKRISLRGDDVTNIMATYDALYGKPYPSRLLRGLCDAIEALPDYTLLKYRQRSHKWSLADVICVARPKPKDAARGALYRSLIEGTAKMPTTWETEASKRGNDATVWDELLHDGKLPYMACLRNLRNIVNTGADQSAAARLIADPKRVASSRQLPMRFLSAYRTLPPKTSRELVDAVESALDLSLANMPKLPGKTLVAIDSSASMDWGMSARSKVKISDVAALLGISIAITAENVYVVSFDDEVKFHRISENTRPLEFVNSFKCPGGCTLAYKIFEFLDANDLDVDRIIVLSDNQANGQIHPLQEHMDVYRARVDHKVWMHAWDLEGYGTQQFRGQHTNLIAGWSERAIELISLAETGAGSLLDAVEAVEL